MNSKRKSTRSWRSLRSQPSSYPVWHPFTQMSEWKDPVVIDRASGSYLYDTRGRKYLDGNASLWVNVHGHRHPVITRAIKRQLDRVAHSTLLGLANVPATELARQLVKAAPSGLTRVFFSDNGATSVEIALKMAFQFWRHQGQPKRQAYIHLDQTYHGDTVGALSVGGVPLFRETFRPLLFKTHAAPSFHCARCPWNRERLSPEDRFRRSTPYAAARGRCRWECIGAVEALMKRHRGAIAAMVVEVKVEAAAGMLTAPAGYLKRLKALCRKYDVLLIADEVAVGFGRTGKMFASEHEQVSPDFLCLAKGLTGGYLPMAATVTTERVFRAFLGRYEEWKTFFHGHSYAGNQLGAAAALANLDVFRRERVLERLPGTIRQFRAWLAPLASLPCVGDVRQAGMLAGVELVANRHTLEPFPPAVRVAHQVCLGLRKEGIWLRPLGNVIPLVPPLSISRVDLKRMCEALYRHLVAL